MTDLTKGSRTPLPQPRWTVRLLAERGGAALVDLAAVLLGPDRRVRGDDDVVFFNQPVGPGARVDPDGTVAVDLERIPAGVERVVITGTTEPQGVRFDAVHAPCAIVEGEGETHRFAIGGLISETTVMLVAFYRRGGGWKLDAVGQGYAGGFAAFAHEHGIAHEPAPDQDPGPRHAPAEGTAPQIEARVVVPSPPSVRPAAAPVPAATAPQAPPAPPAPPAPARVDEAERRWHEMRRRGDVDAAVETVLEAHDRGEVPEWLARGRADLVDQLVRAILADLDDDHTPAGYQLIRLSSACEGGQPFGLLGLASVCMQEGEQGGVINEKIPDLLHSLLAVVDMMPTDAFPPYVRGWRELAIRRVEGLVRLSWGRRVNAVRERYADAVRMAQLVLVYDVAEDDLARIRATLPLLREAHAALVPYRPLLEHPEEKALLVEDLELLENLVDVGVDTLNTPRR